MNTELNWNVDQRIAVPLIRMAVLYHNTSHEGEDVHGARVQNDCYAGTGAYGNIDPNEYVRAYYQMTIVSDRFSVTVRIVDDSGWAEDGSFDAEVSLTGSEEALTGWLAYSHMQEFFPAAFSPWASDWPDEDDCEDEWELLFAEHEIRDLHSLEKHLMVSAFRDHVLQAYEDDEEAQEVWDQIERNSTAVGFRFNVW